MRTITVDRKTWDEMVEINNKYIDLQRKLGELARNIDHSHKCAKDRLNHKNLTKEDIEVIAERIGTTEYISRKIEHLFHITVLSSEEIDNATSH